MQNNRGSVIAVNYYPFTWGVDDLLVRYRVVPRWPRSWCHAIRFTRTAMTHETNDRNFGDAEIDCRQRELFSSGKTETDLHLTDNEWQSRDACDCMCIKQESITRSVMVQHPWICNERNAHMELSDTTAICNSQPSGVVNSSKLGKPSPLSRDRCLRVTRRNQTLELVTSELNWEKNDPICWRYFSKNCNVARYIYITYIYFIKQ